MVAGRSAADWLLENAGPVIRYRVATELLGVSDERKADSLRRELLSDELVQYWLAYLRPGFGRNDMHGGKTEAFENAMGKLYEFGLRKGVRVFDERTRPFRRWLAEQIHLPNEGYFPTFYRTLAAAFLSMTEYSDDDAVDTMIMKRLDTVYPFAKRGKVDDVYVPQDSFGGFPKSFRRYPLINPEFHVDDEMQLPWIHDVNAFLHSSRMAGDAEFRKKVEAIVAFILRPEYQKLPQGYGVIRRESGQYYAMGWSVHLPGYLESKVQAKDFGRFLLWLNLLSRSETARGRSWFRRSLSMLEGFRAEDGLVAFPRSFLPEKRFGYWVWGSRMGLEANRRVQKAITCESTFRFLQIASKAV
jgi:hypothetical protein